MIAIPDRLGEVIAAIERGEQVDCRKIADLQALDLAQTARQFADEAAAYNEQHVEMAKQFTGTV